jgi:hypothetical protein
MKNILYAWEYGIDLEHINIFLPIVKKIQAKGHNIQMLIPFSASNFSLVKKILVENELMFLDIPSVQIKINDEKIESHSELMQQLSCFRTQEDFQFSFKSWLTLFEEETPDLVICDFAPVALLAAQQLGIPTVLFDLGFFVPDTHQASPSFIHYPISFLQTIHNTALTNEEQKSEKHLLEMVNATYSELNFSPVNKFTDFYKANKTLWLNHTELSPFTHATNTQFAGIAASKNNGIAPHWQLNRFESPKIFAYLNQDNPASMIIIQALRHHKNLDSIIYIPNCHREIKRAYDSDNLIIEYQPMNISQILEGADLIINNAEAGLIAQSLLAGKPLLLAPSSFEQCLNTNRAVKLGAAIRLRADITHASVMEGIYTLLGNGFYTVSARAFAMKYQPITAELIADTIVETIPDPKRNHVASTHKLEPLTTD